MPRFNRARNGHCPLAVASAMLIPVLSRAQDTGQGSVAIEGVVATQLPVLGNVALALLAVMLVFIALVRLRQTQTLMMATLGVATVLVITATRQPIAEMAGLVVPADSPVCEGATETLFFDPLAPPPLTNQCATTAVRINGYELPCTAGAGDLSTGELLRPGETRILLPCRNEPPRFTLAFGELTLAEDTGPQTYAGWLTDLAAGPALEVDAGQTVGLAVTTDFPALFAVQPTVDGSGTLRFTPADNAFGSTLITVTASDSEGATASQTLALTITPVNDPPSFSAPATLTVLEDAGLDMGTVIGEPQYDDDPDVNGAEVLTTGFASQISPGNSWESDQSVNFEVQLLWDRRYDDPESFLDLFSAVGDPPWITLSPTGDLVFDLMPHHWGEGELEIVLVDAEGARSEPHLVQVRVAPVWDDPPTSRSFNTVGRENSECIPVNLRVWRPDFNGQSLTWLMSAMDLNGGQLLYGENNEHEVGPLPDYPDLMGVRGMSNNKLCYRPPANRHSSFDPVTGQFDTFASLHFKVWTGVGNPYTGESPPLPGETSSGVFHELSLEEYQIDIVVTPVF